MAQILTTQPSVTILSPRYGVLLLRSEGVEKKLRQLKSVADMRVDLEAKKVKVWLAANGNTDRYTD